MKSLLPILICCIFFLAPSLQAQEEYTVDGETYSLKSEVKGDLELLWNVIDNHFRYFLKKGDYITELKNTKVNGKYQEDYKEVLKEQTADVTISTKKVDLTLPSLQRFFVKYNTLKDPAFVDTKVDSRLNLRLGAYGGVTNSIYTSNINNTNQAVGGLELELVDLVNLKRHSLVLGFRHTFESSDYKYSVSQLSLNYRFKFIKSSRFDMYVNTKFASLSFFEIETSVDDEGVSKVINESGTDFSSPIAFGIGADIMVGNGYITLGYHDIVALNMDNNKEFPIDFSLGYKFNL